MVGIASLFSGIGGIELGMRKHLPDVPLLLLCEINESARRVLRAHFPDVHIHDDVRTLEALPEHTTVVTAGSPCTDLSSFGTCTGIHGASSSLVDEVFRLVAACPTVETIVLENVPNLLRLKGGEGIRHVTTQLEGLGFTWAHRVLDSRAFGLRQTRKRVLLVACRHAPPPLWLFASRPWSNDDGRVEPTEEALVREGFAGFYINEGFRGSSFRVGVAPTLKCNGNGGLKIAYAGHPHCLILPPHTRDDGARVVYLDVEDAERVQGLPAGWTAPAGTHVERYARIGNSVPPPFAEFVGAGIAGRVGAAPGTVSTSFQKWPDAAFGGGGAAATAVPQCTRAVPLDVVTPLDSELRHVGRCKPVGPRGARGFLKRATRGSAAMPGWALAVLKDAVM